MKNIIAKIPLISLFAFVAMLAFIPFASASLSDIKNHKYQKAIEFIFEKGIVKGYPDGTFKPDQTISRAELVTIAVGSLYKNLPKKDCFPDVKKTNWFSPFVCKAKSLKVVAGYADGTFKPDKPVTFVEALIILQKAYGIKVDTSKGEKWFEDSVKRAAEMNIIPLNVKRFDMPFTRADMAELMTRLLKQKENKLDEYLGEKSKVKVTYDDIKAGIDVETKVPQVKEETSAPPPASSAEVYINGKKLTGQQLDGLKQTYGSSAANGRYWYDERSGLFGLEGSASAGFIMPSHEFGPLARNASNGTTGVILNGRELPEIEYLFLAQLVGTIILPGEYWFDGASGNMGISGSDAPLVNYWLLLSQAGAMRNGSGEAQWSSNATGAGGNSSGGCSYINIPGSSGVSSGFASLGC